MTAPETAGQAAPGMTWEAWYLADGNSRTLAQDFNESKHDAMRRAFHAGAIAAAAPAPGATAREQVIARLAAAFGPHKAAVSRQPDEDHRHPWTEFVPSGNDERGSTLIVFRDVDGENSMRALTYGEIADALCEPPEDRGAERRDAEYERYAYGKPGIQL